MSVRLIYLDEFADEVVPCDCTLPAWAEWLSKPDEDWGREEAAEDGEVFVASVTRLEDDIIATPDACGWVFDHLPDNPDFLAVRFGPGLGWDPDNIVWEQNKIAALREHLMENFEPEEGSLNIAVGYEEPGRMVTFRAGPPPRLDEALVQ